MVVLETQNNPYLGGDSSLSCSPQTRRTILIEMVVDTVKHGYDTAMDLLEKNQKKLHELAKYLYEKETITGEEFMQILTRTGDVGRSRREVTDGKKQKQENRD